jgi:quercetin dioxygenase-like cupin family protein
MMNLSELKIDHHFVGVRYAKVTTIPAGAKLTQHVHTFDHDSVLLLGTARVTAGAKVSLLSAPAIIFMPAGIPHEVEAVQDCLWACLWANPEGHSDPEKFDAGVIAHG